MNGLQFAYWLRGFFEGTKAKTLDEEQTKLIEDHLKLVITEVEKPVDYCTPFGLSFNETKTNGTTTTTMPEGHTLTCSDETEDAPIDCGISFYRGTAYWDGKPVGVAKAAEIMGVTSDEWELELENIASGRDIIVTTIANCTISC